MFKYLSSELKRTFPKYYVAKIPGETKLGIDNQHVGDHYALLIGIYGTAALLWAGAIVAILCFRP